MSVTGRVGIGIPLVLLYEAEGLVVTIESKLGELYRGILIQAEDSMNCFLRNVAHTDRSGKVSKLEQVHIRGSMIRFIVFPDVLSRSPMFKRVVKHKQTKGRYVPQGSGTESAGKIIQTSQRPGQQNFRHGRNNNSNGRPPHGSGYSGTGRR